MALDIGSVPQLFLDGRVIAATEGCHLQLHRPTRWTGNPVIRAEEPWENPERGDGVTHFGGSVLYDEEERLFKMWYRLSELAPTPRFRSEAGSRGEVNSIDGAVPYGGYRSAYAVGLADCDPFSGDEIRHVVTWNGRSDVGRLSGEEVRLTFELRNAALYSFGFRGERTGAGPINLLSPGSRGFPGR